MNGPLLRRPNLVKDLVRNLKLRMLRLNFAALPKSNHIGIPIYAFAKKGIIKIYNKSECAHSIFNPIHHSIFFLPLVTAGGGHHPPYDKNNEFLYF